jgi:hypothetical protein
MDRLDETFAGERHSVGTYVGAAAFVAGLVLVGIGALSVLLDGLAGAVPSGLHLGLGLAAAGAAVTAVLVIGVVLLHDQPVDRPVRVGLAGSALGIGLVVPASMITGPVGTAGLVLSGLCYLAGSLTLTGVVFEGAIATDLPTGAGQASYVRDSGAGGPSPGVADGGRDDDELEFLLDEDDRD